ncbi:potassium/proton antiporter [soil metagenome]
MAVFTIDDILLGVSILMLLSILASKTSGRLGVPALLIFLGVGMLAGSEGLGGIYFDDNRLAQSLGIISLTFILFSGGLDTKWESVRPVFWRGVTLSTVGVFCTALLVGVFVSFLADFTFLEGLLLGAIVSSTDAAAVFSILRAKSVGLKANLRPTLELESGSNDPMAYFLTITLTSLLVNPEAEIGSLVVSFFKQMIFGGLLGYGFGQGMAFLINRIRLEYEGLYPVLTISLVLLAYSLTTYIGGNGFLAVYVAAVILGNKNFIHKKSLLRFYDGIAWLMQIMMFLVLGLLVFPSQIVPVIGIGLLISVFLILVARPVGVFISLLNSRASIGEKTMISWVGLRGAVPIVFATYPLIANVEKAPMIFNIVFFIVLTSVILQGTTLSVFARWLKVDEPVPVKPKYPLELEMHEGFMTELIEVMIPESSQVVGQPLVQIGFPRGSLIVMINRGDQYLRPNGATILEANDILQIMTEAEDEQEKERIYQSLGVASIL